MQKNLIWAVGIIVILGGGFLWWQSMQTATPVNTETQTGTETGSNVDQGENMGAEDAFAASIEYTDAGYSPNTVTIKKGQTVRWINNSAEKTWPASAVHPTHSVYPSKSDSNCLGSDFDACRGLIEGEMWDFTFTAVGEWRFHDHLHPSKTGVVIVTE